ncbi:MAG: PepSY domain-containing protein [Acutalibacteraceae bacterium]
MTKTTKKALSILLTIIMTLSVFVTAFAAITLDEAKAIALKDAGFTESEVQLVTAKDDKEDKEFEIEFYQGKAEYDYSVNYEGKIVAFSFDSNTVISQGKNIDKETAEKTALDFFGKTKQDVTLLRTEYDKEDNDYEVSFVADSVKYEVTVSAFDAEVTQYGYETVVGAVGIISKFKALIEAIIAFFRNLFVK